MPAPQHQRVYLLEGVSPVVIGAFGLALSVVTFLAGRYDRSRARKANIVVKFAWSFPVGHGGVGPTLCSVAVENHGEIPVTFTQAGFLLAGTDKVLVNLHDQGQYQAWGLTKSLGCPTGCATSSISCDVEVAAGESGLGSEV